MTATRAVARLGPDVITASRLRGLRAVGLAALSIALLAACGGESSTSNNTPAAEASPSSHKAATLTLPADICATLVTADDASAALGTPVTNLAAQGGSSIPGACFYGSQGSSAGMLVFAQAYPDATTADAVSPDQMAAIYRGAYGISNAKSVTGIGDKAFEYTATSNQSGSGGIAIFVFKANVLLMIFMSGSKDSTKDSANIEALAKAAVGRLS